MVDKKSKISKEDFENLFNECVVATQEALEILNISRPALHKMVTSGRIKPLRKLNNVTLYWRQDIEEQASELKEKFSRRK